MFLQRNYKDQRDRTEIIVAQAARLPELNPGQSVNGRFYNGHYYLIDNRETQDVSMQFKELTITFPHEAAQARYRRKAETTARLAISRQPKDIAEFQWRMSAPMATLLMALSAVPLARSKPRESRFRIFFVAIALYVGGFSMFAVARTWIEQGKISPVPGLWGVYFFLGLVLLALLITRR